MRRNFLKLMIAAVAVVGVQFAAVAADNGSADEAKAMVEKAVKLIQAEGKEKAFAQFDDPKGAFVDRDLYVFVLNMEGVTISHGANKALIGKSLFNLKDADGKLFIQEIVEMGKANKTGWVDYKWANPQTKKVEAKSSYMVRVGDVLVGVGIYKG